MERAPRLHPAPLRPPEPEAPASIPAGKVSVDSYFALRGVPARRRAARRALAGDLRVATIDEFDRAFARLRG